MATRLTPSQKQHILRRYEEGVPLRAIGREVGRPDITIRRVLEAAGVSLGPPRTVNQRTSPETEALVLHLYGDGCTWEQINEQAGITSATLSKILRRHGRSFDRRSDAEINAGAIGVLYEAGYSTRDIGVMLGHGKSTVNAVVVRHGGKVRQFPGCQDGAFFEDVNTPQKAYWLGFLSADGCIITTRRHPEGSHISVMLAARDKGHLVKFKDAVGATAGVHEIVSSAFGKETRAASLSVGSRRLTQALLALGIGPRKSAVLQPWDGPAHLMPHYWRGLFDGDGSLAVKGTGLWTAFLCGSEACVSGFRDWAHDICGTSATPYFKTGCWYVSISGRYQLPLLVRAMYADATVSLDRKQVIADRILASEQPRKKPGPARRIADETEWRERRRQIKNATQRRYMERKRQATASIAD